jgi:hypothetical protein
MRFGKKKEEPIAKIGTKDEAFWTEVKDSAIADIARLEKLLKLQNAIKTMCEMRIAAEKVAIE